MTSAAPLTSLVAADPIYKGEQITLRQFKPIAQGGIFAKFSGKQRAVAVMGEPQQLLAGTLTDGDRVDVVATTRYHVGPSPARRRASSYGTCSCSRRPTPTRRRSSAPARRPSATLVMSDSQAQTMGWAMKMSTWFLALRPTKARATASRASRRCTRSSRAA